MRSILLSPFYSPPLPKSKPKPFLPTFSLHKPKFKTRTQTETQFTSIHNANPIQPEPKPEPETLTQFTTRHNKIKVIQIPRSQGNHPLSGTRLLLLDTPGNIHSLSHPYKPQNSLPLSHSYYDVFATLPAVVSAGPVGVFGFGAGTCARLVLGWCESVEVHGWEIDREVLEVGREFFELGWLEREYAGRLFVKVGNALDAEIHGGFSGILVDLFSKGCLIPELQDPLTWRKMKQKLREGGRVMVNVGGSCVEPEDKNRDGRVIMEETLAAMSEGFGGEISVLSLGDREDDSSIALTGKLPEADVWRKGLPKALRIYADMWKPYARSSKHCS